VKELIALALDHPDACYDADKHLPKEALIEHYTTRLASKAELLEDFFAIKFAASDEEESKDNQDLCLEALPVVVNCIEPFAQELPMFILRLASEVDYSDEQGCIHQVASELAFYYARYVDYLTLQAQAVSYGHSPDTSS